MIKPRNMGFYDLILSIAGTLSTTGVGQAIARAPFAGFVSNLIAAVGIAANGTVSTKVDLNKNGTTVFSATTTQISFAGTTGTASYGALTTNPIAVAAGDVFTLDVDTIGVQHNGCTVVLTVSRMNPAATGNQTDETTVI